ncbi:hypothetical protein GCM10009799_24640 [Nocardiopsis rhodophaea]|uniref:Uncharacterized protein n=1 Tax=Nocardiopsis rhodophaea TaxID=280238 RepID=A0ABP5EIR5_9ACTN
MRHAAAAAPTHAPAARSSRGSSWSQASRDSIARLAGDMALPSRRVVRTPFYIPSREEKGRRVAGSGHTSATTRPRAGEEKRRRRRRRTDSVDHHREQRRVAAAPAPTPEACEGKCCRCGQVVDAPPPRADIRGSLACACWVTGVR